MGRHSSRHSSRHSCSHLGSSSSSSSSSRTSSHRGSQKCDTVVCAPDPAPAPEPEPEPAPEPPCRDWCDDELVRRFNRQSRYSGYPTRYIVNDGSLVVSESLLRDSNTLILNRTGSSMRVRPDGCCCDGTSSCRCGCRGRRCCRGRSGGRYSCCYCRTTTTISTTTRITEYCRSCVCRPAWYGGYCRECREYVRPLADCDRRLLDGPCPPRLLEYR
ncbi:uncharacterized protein PG986_013997 [Apiospora aurea]|uniref:Uncharacterized protein n=1 Tax=Apiospora aurea TaxID=335848 RepID=A0ABR1PX76_9PEZI